VTIEGVWDGKQLTPTEDFVYEYGSTEQRVWTLMIPAPTLGTAPPPAWPNGVRMATSSTGATPSTCPSPPPVAPASTVRVTLDDWMWLLSDDRLLNRAYTKRYGADVGDVTITFKKLR